MTVSSISQCPYTQLTWRPSQWLWRLMKFMYQNYWVYKQYYSPKVCLLSPILKAHVVLSRFPWIPFENHFVAWYITPLLYNMGIVSLVHRAVLCSEVGDFRQCMCALQSASCLLVMQVYLMRKWSKSELHRRWIKVAVHFPSPFQLSVKPKVECVHKGPHSCMSLGKCKSKCAFAVQLSCPYSYSQLH